TSTSHLRKEKNPSHLLYISGDLNLDDSAQIASRRAHEVAIPPHNQVRSSEVVLIPLSGYESGVIRASKFRAYHTPLNEQGDYVNAMRAARVRFKGFDSLKLSCLCI
ncbi:NPC intracellular cholesterol transporter 1, partial [Dionaea muscipula]